MKMQGYMLDKVLNSTKGSVSDDELRPTLTGVCFDLKEDGVTFVATNGFKLQQYDTKIKGNGAKIIVLPVSFNGALGLSDEEVTISFNEVNISFSYIEDGEFVKVTGRLVDGNYPPYEKVVPKELPHEAIVDNGEISEAIKRASLFSPGESKQIVLEVSENHVGVMASNANYATSSDQVIDATSTGSKTIRAKSSYFLDVLKIAGEGKVKISFGPDSNAVLINNALSPNFTGLVMMLGA